MKLYFTEVEESDQTFFQDAFPEHDLTFSASASQVPPDAEILSVFISTKIDALFLDEHPQLRLIFTRSTTCDHIDLTACAQRNVTVMNVTSYGDHIVAEHTFALLLALTRRLRESMVLGTSTHFSYEALRGIELHRKTFGIIGAGRIGLSTIPIARGLGMHVIACDLKPQPARAAALGFDYVSFKQLLSCADVISLHVPLTSKTFHLLDANAFEYCKPGVLIINTARGRLIDTTALLAAMEAGVVRGAGLDVLSEEALLRRQTSRVISDQIFSRLQASSTGVPRLGNGHRRTLEFKKLVDVGKLLARPDVVFTPHIAFNCSEALERINAATVVCIRNFIAGEPIESVGTCPAKYSVHARAADEFCLTG